MEAWRGSAAGEVCREIILCMQKYGTTPAPQEKNLAVVYAGFCGASITITNGPSF